MKKNIQQIFVLKKWSSLTKEKKGLGTLNS